MKNVICLQLQRAANGWLVIDTSGPKTVSNVATICLDHQRQIDQVLISADATEEQELEVLHLVASHVRAYPYSRHEPRFESIGFQNTPIPRLEYSDSDRAMDFGKIEDDIRTLGRDEIIRVMRRSQVEIITVIHPSAQVGIEKAIQAVSEQVPVSWEFCSDDAGFSGRRIMVQTRAPHSFTFWNKVDVPNGPDGMQLIPNYHPVWQRGTEVGMINGDTDAVCGGKVVRMIYAPKQAQTVLGAAGSSWKRVDHPFRVTGESFELTVGEGWMRSQTGVDKLIEILLAALGIGDRYLTVNGGFLPPLKYPSNRLNEIGRGNDSPYPDASSKINCRGTEAHCVWAHRVLTEEGVLENSYVPKWFIEEDWLGIYADAEVSAELY